METTVAGRFGPGDTIRFEAWVRAAAPSSEGTTSNLVVDTYNPSDVVTLTASFVKLSYDYTIPGDGGDSHDVHRGHRERTGPVLRR
jgi:hypothetical protein